MIEKEKKLSIFRHQKQKVAFEPVITMYYKKMFKVHSGMNILIFFYDERYEKERPRIRLKSVEK